MVLFVQVLFTVGYIPPNLIDVGTYVHKDGVYVVVAFRPRCTEMWTMPII